MSKKSYPEQRSSSTKICKRIPPKKNPLSAHFPTRICEVVLRSFSFISQMATCLRRGHVSFSPSVAARSCSHAHFLCLTDTQRRSCHNLA
ncbi:hypothetical protein CEXT_776001 [Caerostris extrusa]|uniref:Uncharacterized protein n=1 Tax=Caerostris extrusa TaxID=172846 RepID=A0AAV4XNE8_CAEEX|nr:hypothetical protein CEXT_776001 [Caerostris extrusa]